MKLAGPQPRRFLLAQVPLGCAVTIILTYVSYLVADSTSTPQFVKYVIAPGYVLGLKYATGRGLLEWLGSFGHIFFTVELFYFGLASFFVLRWANWPKFPANPRHRLWMQP